MSAFRIIHILTDIFPLQKGTLAEVAKYHILNWIINVQFSMMNY